MSTPASIARPTASDGGGSMAGIAVFSGASLVCGISQSEGTLLVARGLQGLGGAMVSPAALSIILTTFAEGPARNRALAVWGAIA